MVQDGQVQLRVQLQLAFKQLFGILKKKCLMMQLTLAMMTPIVMTILQIMITKSEQIPCQKADQLFQKTNTTDSLTSRDSTDGNF